MDLSRSILLTLRDMKEAGTGGHIEFEESDFPGHSLDEVSFHVKLLWQAGYVEAIDRTTYDAFRWHPKSLTWAGYEFLEAIENDTVWNKTKDRVQEHGGSVPFEVVKELAVQILRSTFGLS